MDLNKDFNEIVDYKNQKIKYGRYLFNKCLPEDYPVVDEVVTDKKLSAILDDIAFNYDPETVMKTLDKIKNFGFKVSTKHGYTLSIDDMYNKKFEKYVKKLSETDHNKNLEILAKNEFIQDLENKDYYDFVKSGARGNVDQLRQMLLTRGYVADASNKIRNKLIKSSYLSGLNESEFFDSAWGTRKGLMDTAHSTSSGGFLTRQMIYSTTTATLGDEKDCGSKEYLMIKPRVMDMNTRTKDEKRTNLLLKSILWRYAEVDNKLVLITNQNLNMFAQMDYIKLRTPVYCKNKNICHTCYGNLYKILHSKEVGIIAAQSISERITQLILRTFHFSGAAAGGNAGDDKQDKNKDIVHDISTVNKILHNPEKYKKNISPLRIVRDLHYIFCTHGNINMIHYEILVSSMMRTADGKLWRLNRTTINDDYKFESILRIPSMDSWLLGLAFIRLKSKLLDGVMNNDLEIPTSISEIFRF